MLLETEANNLKLVSGIILSVITMIFLNKNSIENFEIIPYGSKSGFGFQQQESTEPLFNNFFREMGQDFQLGSLIKRLRYQNLMARGNQSSPIFLVPEIGSSKIYARWNRTGTQAVRKLDAYGNFETKEKWSCKEVQDTWTSIWFPESQTGLPLYCWKDNASIKFDNEDKNIGPLAINASGVSTSTESIGSISFEPSGSDTGLGLGGNYGSLIKSFQSLGYVLGTSLFGVPYDFRKICSSDEMENFMRSFINTIERSVSYNNKKAVLIGHGLGAVLINYVLTFVNQDWKDLYIAGFISVGGSFGGCPKALRVLLSGEISQDKTEQNIIRDTTMNFTGLQWMLPIKEVYGDKPLIFYKESSYTAKDIPELLKIAGTMVGSPDAANIYENIVSDVAIRSIKAPHVNTYILGGINVKTESNYNFKDSLINEPIKNYPYYRVNTPNYTNADFPSDFNGDGTIPKFVLEFPLSWSKIQKHPVNFKFYDNATHDNILLKYESVKDILDLVNQFNS
jgi:lecithin-cholesterol acyltransferase